MSKFAHQFQKRTDIVPHLKEGLKCDALLVVGTKSSHLHAAEYMHSQMDKVRSVVCKRIIPTPFFLFKSIFCF